MQLRWLEYISSAAQVWRLVDTHARDFSTNCMGPDFGQFAVQTCISEIVTDKNVFSSSDRQSGQSVLFRRDIFNQSLKINLPSDKVTYIAYHES